MLHFGFQLFRFEQINNYAMKEDRLKKMIKAMYLIRETLKQKREDDKAFRFKSKTRVLTEVDTIIDRSLEEFYSLRVN